MLSAPESPASRPPVLSAMVACRTVADRVARLDCYDKAVTALERAEQRRDIVVVDRKASAAKQRGAFGIAAPRTDDGAPLPSEITTTLASAQPFGGAALLFVLADGARWVQTDDAPVGGRLRPGETVVVRRSTLGGYKLTVGKRPAVKVRRLAR